MIMDFMKINHFQVFLDLLKKNKCESNIKKYNK